MVLTLERTLTVGEASCDDVPMMVTLDQKIWGKEMYATEDKLISRIETFPDGQVVAKYNGKVVGFMNSQKIKGDDTFQTYRNGTWTWPVITSEGYINGTHTPYGDVLFLLNLTVDVDVPALPGNKSTVSRTQIGAELVKYLCDVAIKHNVKRKDGITRVNGFARYMNSVPEYTTADDERRKQLERQYIDKYVEIIKKDLDPRYRDPSLKFHLRQGAELICPVENAMPGDYDSLLWGYVIVYRIEHLKNKLKEDERNR